eukprot:2965927-Prymnesium_polylepis.1
MYVSATEACRKDAESQRGSVPACCIRVNDQRGVARANSLQGDGRSPAGSMRVVPWLLAYLSTCLVPSVCRDV